MSSLRTCAFIIWLFLATGCHLVMKVPDGPADPALCGNGQLDSNEQCDGENLNNASCESLEFASGTLACNADCTFNTSTCVPTTCGDGQLDPGEQCDTKDLGEASCESLGFASGELDCTDSCTFDTSLCVPASCGNGQLDDGEQCDGEHLGTATCQTYGFYGGELSCGSTCRHVTTGCIGHCGDGILQAGHGEVCDGEDIGNITCADLGFSAGTPICRSDCTGVSVDGCHGDYLSPHIGLVISVPAGTFQRNSSGANISSVSAFRMSQHEITRAQWVAVTGWQDPSSEHRSSGIYDPVQRVSFYDAIAFCNILSLTEGRTPVYHVSGVDFATLDYSQIPSANDETWNAVTANWDADGYRLPTVMEWMWAAMGADSANPGMVNTTGYSKPFAGSNGTNLIQDYAVFGYNTEETGRTPENRTNPAGSKLPNEIGLHDLSGNINEWVWDWWHGSHPAGPLTDYRGPETGTERIVLGGDWYNSSHWCAISSRIGWTPHSRAQQMGFRVVFADR